MLFDTSGFHGFDAAGPMGRSLRLTVTDRPTGGHSRRCWAKKLAKTLSELSEARLAPLNGMLFAQSPNSGSPLAGANAPRDSSLKVWGKIQHSFFG